MSVKEVLNELTRDLNKPGDVLRAFRKRKGFSQMDLSKLTGVEDKNISAIENHRLNLTQHYAELFAAALGLHPNELLYPKGYYKMSKKALEIQKKSIEFVNKMKEL